MYLKLLYFIINMSFAIFSIKDCYLSKQNKIPANRVKRHFDMIFIYLTKSI